MFNVFRQKSWDKVLAPAKPPVVESAEVEILVSDQFAAVRAMVGQEHDARNIYAPAPDLARYLAQYALNTWVYTAVARLAEACATAKMRVVWRNDHTRSDDSHGLARLVGEYGIPNDEQSAFEFWEDHFTFMELCGNSYWYWEGGRDGSPRAVHLLPPASVRVIPGKTQTVAGYEFNANGAIYKLATEQVTHFKRPNPYSRYYGLPALEALMISVLSDREMARWNYEFFGDGVAVPAGVFVIPPSVSDKERDRFDREFNAKHGQRRRTAIVRAPPGSTIWHNAGITPQEASFKDGRMLTRQEVYEALDLPLGYMSEASTEAHARVAERRFLFSVYRRHIRIASKLNVDGLNFWPGWNTRLVQFEDIRHEAADWEQTAKRLKAVEPYMAVDEVRTEILGMQALGGEHATLKSSGQPDNRRDSSAVQPDGQVPDVLDE